MMVFKLLNVRRDPRMSLRQGVNKVGSPPAPCLQRARLWCRQQVQASWPPAEVTELSIREAKAVSPQAEKRRGEGFIENPGCLQGLPGVLTGH